MQKRAGAPITPDVWNGADMPPHLRLNFRVVDDAGRERLTAALQKLDVGTFYGRIKFAADGAADAHPPLAVQIQDGKKVAVFPENVAAAKLRYPMPPWKARG